MAFSDQFVVSPSAAGGDEPYAEGDDYDELGRLSIIALEKWEEERSAMPKPADLSPKSVLIAQMESARLLRTRHSAETPGGKKYYRSSIGPGLSFSKLSPNNLSPSEHSYPLAARHENTERRDPNQFYFGTCVLILSTR